MSRVSPRIRAAAFCLAAVAASGARDILQPAHASHKHSRRAGVTRRQERHVFQEAHPRITMRQKFVAKKFP